MTPWKSVRSRFSSLSTTLCTRVLIKKGYTLEFDSDPPSNFQDTQGPRKSESSGTIIGGFSGSESPYSGAPEGAWPGSIFPCLCCKETIGKVQVNPETPTPEQICEIQTVQDGVDLCNNQFPFSRLPHGHSRSQGCLLAHPDTSGLSKIPKGWQSG